MDEKTTVETEDGREITVSTVELDFAHGPERNQHYETCLFWDEGSRVKERYETHEAAKNGHRTYVQALMEAAFEVQEHQPADIVVHKE